MKENKDAEENLMATNKQHVGERLTEKDRGRQIDRGTDGKREKGPNHLVSHPAGRTGPLYSFSVQTHLTAVCSLQQQCIRTHTAVRLTGGTITLLRGIDKGAERESEENEIEKKIDQTHTHTHVYIELPWYT